MKADAYKKSLQRTLDEATGACQSCGDDDILAPVGDDGDHVCSGCIESNPKFRHKLFGVLLDNYGSIQRSTAIAKEQLNAITQLEKLTAIPKIHANEPLEKMRKDLEFVIKTGDDRIAELRHNLGTMVR